VFLDRLRSSWTVVSSFAGRLRANVAATRSLNDQLVADHGITIEQYEILSRLRRAPNMRLRQADLNVPALVTAANVGRVLRDLERSRLVDRSSERVVAMTDEGREKVRMASSPQLDELLSSSPPQ
jgi:DNA-binding MarR family transcriptional regulator